MKSLKLVFSVIALAIAFGGPIAKAQDAKRQSEADKAKAAFNLTDDQYNKVKAIYKDATTQKRALANDESKKAKETEINNATKAKIRDVLTPEQQARFDEANKKNPGKGGNKGGDKGGKGGEKPKGGDKKKKDAE